MPYATVVQKKASNIFGVDFETECIILCGHPHLFVNKSLTEVPTYQFLGRRLD